MKVTTLPTACTPNGRRNKLRRRRESARARRKAELDRDQGHAVRSLFWFTIFDFECDNDNRRR